MHWLWWLVAAIVLGVIEVLTLDLVLLMFAVGATAAIVANVAGASVTVQVLAFAATSLVMLVGLRPYLLRNLRRRTPLVETNAAGLVGRAALTLSEVTARGGLVKLAGEEWSARTTPGAAAIPADVEARVLRIDGATAVVGPLEPDEPPASTPHVPTPPDDPEDRS
ncbi:NfeD family protein [Cellulomonas sp. APG4]|nr:NfeD family protein [Cellulomonas sp. APG4]